MPHDNGPDPVLISVRNACKTYQMGEVEVHALRDASIDVRRGELLVVVGPSGSGKSTLLNIVGGMDRPSSGNVLFDGRDLAQASDAELTRFRRTRIGFVFQFYNLVPTLTARENVQVAVEIATDPLDADEALDKVGLLDRADHFPSQMSGGEQQRIAIARALAATPDLLLCDEPTGAIDLETSRRVLGILAELKRETGTPVVIITHNNAIAEMADRVAHIRDGAIRSIETNDHPVPVEEVSW